MLFKVSVIIPVYNCENFIRKSVESALSCTEVFEIILVEDGSSDSSLKICKALEDQFEKIKLYIHFNNENRGPSASRNLGVIKATCEYISFLDADDWYLEHRFKKDKSIFIRDSKVDAAYSCVILEENIDHNHLRYGVKSNPGNYWGDNLTPLQTYRKVLETKVVLFHTNSITFKRNFLLQHKLFDERLFLHQDTELWLRLIRTGVFYPSEWENPVAIIRRHSNNRITSRSAKSSLKMMAVLIDNIGFKNLYDFEIDYFFVSILRKESDSFDNNFLRRISYYSKYILNQFSKKRIIAKFREYNA